MKRPIQLLACLTLFGPTDLLAQDIITYGDAEITSEFCVTIDTEKPVNQNYIIDISHLDLESEKIANDKFGYICNNLLTYSVDYDSGNAYLEVHLDRTTDPKDVIWWNDYIQSLCGL